MRQSSERNALAKYTLLKVLRNTKPEIRVQLIEFLNDDAINIFDYKTEKRISHFDVLPINHYQISYRELFKRKFFRNISSPYFEMIIRS